MHPEHGIRIGKCIKRMEDAQLSVPEMDRMGRADLLRAAIMMDKMGAISEEGDILSAPSGDELPAPGVLVLEVSDSEDPVEDVSDEPSAETVSYEQTIIDAICHLEKTGAIEVKDKALRSLIELKEEYKAEEEKVEKKEDEMATITSDIAKRFFTHSAGY